ncbi:MAG: hypothetical protein H6626_05670 [Pseudobdellovibrionaceae bacterium]|nr:MAG: hypothetical protein H6626_05670 [Pseudobdellovibrionaceae bacterium]
MAALYFFEKQLLSGISGRSKKNAALLIFTLKTRFHEVYGQPKLEIEAQVGIDPPGTFEFKGRKVTGAELGVEELEEATQDLKDQIKEKEAKIYALENDPDPLTECESSFL